MTAYTLHEHQVRAVKMLHEQSHAALFLPVGAGKTLSVLDALTPDHLPALVVAPKAVAEYVWAQEVAKWRPELSVSLAVGSPTARATAVDRLADITVISRDNLSWLVSYLKPSRLLKYVTLVLDESQSFKTKSSVRWKAARTVAKHVRNVWELTGTPAGNGLMDLWAQVALLDQGERLGTTLTAFRQRYFYPALVLPNGVVAKWEIKPGSEKAIYQALSDICLHIPLIGLDLPGVTINEVPVDMPAHVWKLYRELKQEKVAEVDLLGGPEMLTIPSAAILSTKLSQITAGSLYVTRYDEEREEEVTETTRLHQSKLDQLSEIVEQTEGGVLVFYRFRFELDDILTTFPQAKSIGTKGAIDQWNSREIPMLLVAHPASAGHGLNLQHGGSTAVWTSLSWDMAEWVQANGRLHRQGQTDHVMIHVLGVPDTIDGQILKAVQGKISVQQALLDALS